MSINWKPVERARRQETYLVGHEAYRGWFVVASIDVHGEWAVEGTTKPLERKPTHFAELNAPPQTFGEQFGTA